MQRTAGRLVSPSHQLESCIRQGAHRLEIALLFRREKTFFFNCPHQQMTCTTRSQWGCGVHGRPQCLVPWKHINSARICFAKHVETCTTATSSFGKRTTNVLAPYGSACTAWRSSLLLIVLQSWLFEFLLMDTAVTYMEKPAITVLPSFRQWCHCIPAFLLHIFRWESSQG